MSEPILNFRKVHRNFEIKAKNNVTINLRSETVWNDQRSPQGLNFIASITGPIKDNREEFVGTLEITLPDDCLLKIDGQLHSLRGYSEEQRHITFVERETFIQPFDFLKIGWIEKEEVEPYGYMRFTKGNLSITAEFKKFQEMSEFRNNIYVLAQAR